jgi:3-methyladenine DNA glycosylase AlkD
MKKADIKTWLEENQDQRGIVHWNDKGKKGSSTLTSYGIGLTKLRKFAKSIGRDATLAKQLWNSKIYEMKVLALLIDDPKTMTVEQAEEQVEQLDGGYLAHVFSSCDATIAKTPFIADLARKWVASKDAMRRRCGYGFIYELSKSKKKTAPEENWFMEHVDRIDKQWKKQDTPVLMAMVTALMGVGMRTKKLNKAALTVAKKIGPVTHSPTCDPFDVVKHLTGEHAKKKLGL